MSFGAPFFLVSKPMYKVKCPRCEVAVDVDTSPACYEIACVADFQKDIAYMVFCVECPSCKHDYEVPIPSWHRDYL